MLNRIIRLALGNRMVVVMASLLLTLWGLNTARDMEVDVFPDLNAPTVVVMTEAKGMAPEEVERLVTFPIETAVNGATDVRRVRSSSTTGFSLVWVEFDWGTDIYKARQIVSEKLAMVQDQLPQTAGTPTLGPQSSILGELMFVNLSADSTSMQDIRTIADWIIRPRLLATGGVAQVAVLGGDVKEYQILVNPNLLRQYGVGLNEVVSAVRKLNDNTSGGILYEYGNEYIIRGMAATTDTTELARSLVKTNAEGIAIRLGDIARVTIGNSVPRMGTASRNARQSVVMTVTKQPNTSTLELTRQIDHALNDARKTLPKDITIDTDVYRQSRFIENSINNVKDALIEGAFFVVIVLFIFLMNARITLISLITIPLSVVATIIVLNMMGVTINTMSLGGLCIAIGSLVDDAIVDVENVFKRLKDNWALPLKQRRKTIDVIYHASREVRMPILNSTLIIIASFLPLFFLSGMEGRMLVPLGIAFIVALCSSTVVALTVTPVLCSFMIRAPKKYDGNGHATADPPIARMLKVHYKRALTWALDHQRTILGSTAVALIAAIIMLMTLGRTFLPPFNEGSMTINISTLPGISLEESDRIGLMAEKLLMTIPEVQCVGRKTGRAELDEHALGVNTSEIEAPYVLSNRNKDEVIEEVRDKLKSLPGVNIEVGAPITHRIDAMLSGTRASIAIKIFGSDLNRMYALGNEIKEKIEGIEGLEDLNVEQQVERPQLQIRPKREMLARYGITMPEFGEMVSILLGGEAVSQVYEGNRTFDLTLKVDENHRHDAKSIGDMAIDAGGGRVPLSMVADIISSAGPNTINRENVERKIVVSANVAGRDLRGVVNDIQETVEQNISMPEGYRVEYGGQFESEQAASQTLMITSVLAIMVIFLLLFNQLRSFTQSAVVLVNLPLALIGGVVAIWLTSGMMSIPAIIGFISLFGIATRNGMLLITKYNDLAKDGLSLKQCVIRGSIDRLNPIMMTALTSALALIPMVIGGDLPGNEIQSPMAKVILGGLFTSTLLNGFIIPIIYMITNKRKFNNTEAADNATT